MAIRMMGPPEVVVSSKCSIAAFMKSWGRGDKPKKATATTTNDRGRRTSKQNEPNEGFGVERITTIIVLLILLVVLIATSSTDCY